jgi:hypothetical protein
LSGAICAAISSLRFDIVTNDATTAMSARWSEGMNRALEAIEYVSLPFHDHLKSFIVIISAHFTPRHNSPPSSWKTGQF